VQSNAGSRCKRCKAGCGCAGAGGSTAGELRPDGSFGDGSDDKYGAFHRQGTSEERKAFKRELVVHFAKGRGLPSPLIEPVGDSTDEDRVRRVVPLRQWDKRGRGPLEVAEFGPPFCDAFLSRKDDVDHLSRGDVVVFERVPLGSAPR
jgi:hypothetical protein